MPQKIDMFQTYCRRALLPEELQKPDSEFELAEPIQKIVDSIQEGTYQHQIILFSGLKPGKTVGAAACLRAWLESRSEIVSSDTPGYFLQVHSLCYQNRTVDRYNRDTVLQSVISTACHTDFLVMDGLFSYLTQNDDLLLQAIYDRRQHSGRTTLVTTSMSDPKSCAGSILFRIARDAKTKVVF